MNWRNLLAHDLRCGLLRKRYLATVGIAAVQCVQCVILLNGYARMGLLPKPGGTWMDYLLFMYMGNPAVKIEGIQNAFNVPIWWLLMVGGCLYLNLDYLLYDLSSSGLQIIVRCETKRKWYLSKCAWNLAATALFFLISSLTALAFAVFTGGSPSLAASQPFIRGVFLGTAEENFTLSLGQGLLVAVLAPYCTVAALSILEMTLNLAVKPVFSFLICLVVMMVSVYFQTPFALGNGAAVCRSGVFLSDGVDPWASIAVAGAVILLCGAAGCFFFHYSDLLGREE